MVCQATRRGLCSVKTQLNAPSPFILQTIKAWEISLGDKPGRKAWEISLGDKPGRKAWEISLGEKPGR